MFQQSIITDMLIAWFLDGRTSILVCIITDNPIIVNTTTG